MNRLVVFVGPALLLAACGSARVGEPTAGPKGLSLGAQRGEIAFMRVCHQCHPAGESGMAPALNNKPLPGFLIRFQVRHGLGAMPSISETELSDDDLDAVVIYLRELRGIAKRS